MNTPSIAFAAALLLALGGAQAQTAPTPTPKVLTDAAPLPAEDRNSMGAVVLQESPVLAQRDLVQTTVARNQQMMTSVMGAGPAPVSTEGAGTDTGITVRDKAGRVLRVVK